MTGFARTSLSRRQGSSRGIGVAPVNPADTNRACPECSCGKKSNRSDQATYRCLACGYTVKADRNAAGNVARAKVTRPSTTAAVDKVKG
ncbi:zinc ribbon domain-containing protein [Deinococcus peraridilitoris]|uniref:zinc ribbon domain-containing protein n=1 Tax=Deinococcus peraridilitoris TaxID=432329 RepID=UPI003CCC0613